MQKMGERAWGRLSGYCLPDDSSCEFGNDGSRGMGKDGSGLLPMASDYRKKAMGL